MVRSVTSLAGMLAVAATAAVPSLHAAPAGKVCAPFKHRGLLYRWQTVGRHWTCASAKPWVVKLADDRVASGAGNVRLKNGPRGLHCYATIATHGRASGGACFAGTWAFPKSGFTWNGT